MRLSEVCPPRIDRIVVEGRRAIRKTGCGHDLIPRTLLSGMVPVQLELKNFLSDGTEAPPLNFDEFEVGCLSGGNGEGKSAQ